MHWVASWLLRMVPVILVDHGSPSPHVTAVRDALALRLSDSLTVCCVAACCNILHYVALCCSVWQCDAACCRTSQMCVMRSRCACRTPSRSLVLQHVAACCSVLQCIAVRGNMLQCVVTRYRRVWCVCVELVRLPHSLLPAVYCRVLQCDALCPSVCLYIHTYI